MIDAVVHDLDSVPSLLAIDPQIRKGLQADRLRMRHALLNDDYYRGRNAQYVPRRPSEEDLDYQARPKRTSKLLRKAIRTLSTPLYKPGPTRTLAASAKVDAWLQGVYADLHVNARMQSANRAAINSGVAALQVEATGNPRRPARIWLWKAHEFAVFTVDGDPCSPWAVVVRDTMPEGREGLVRVRYRAWSAKEVRTYLSDPIGGSEPTVGVEAPHVHAEGSGPSPYPGVLPFVFVRNEPPECDFWDGGIGDSLRECNAEIDREMSDLAEHVKEFLNPRGFLVNATVGLRIDDRAGAFIHLKPPPGTREGDNNIEPKAMYVQAQLGVEAACMNMKNYADATIEELDIPLTAIRSDASTDLSGVAIVAKTLPLVDYTRERQVMFSETEEELAAKLLAVVGTRDIQGFDLARGADGAQRLAVATDPRLTCVWPEPMIPLPTPERDAEDQAALDMGLTDPIEVLAKRRGITLEQAEEQAEAIAGRRKRWNEIMAAAGMGPDGKPPQDPEADPNEPEATPDGEDEAGTGTGAGTGGQSDDGGDDESPG